MEGVKDLKCRIEGLTKQSRLENVNLDGIM
jgi:hypothetical protein